MPGDFIIRTGDMIQVTIPPPAIVPMLLSPVPLVGTGMTVMAAGMAVCLEGDELPPALRVLLPYTAPPFVTPGMGTLTVTLLPTNKTIQTVNGRAILIKGATFPAQFQVTVPAMQPTPVGPVPDPLLVKPGTAQFVTTNVTVLGA
jgi:Contractile injection system spike tip protein